MHDSLSRTPHSRLMSDPECALNDDPADGAQATVTAHQQQATSYSLMVSDTKAQNNKELYLQPDMLFMSQAGQPAGRKHSSTVNTRIQVGAPNRGAGRHEGGCSRDGCNYVRAATHLSTCARQIGDTRPCCPTAGPVYSCKCGRSAPPNKMRITSTAQTKNTHQCAPSFRPWLSFEKNL